MPPEVIPQRRILTTVQKAAIPKMRVIERGKRGQKFRRKREKVQVGGDAGY